LASQPSLGFAELRLGKPRSASPSYGSASRVKAAAP